MLTPSLCSLALAALIAAPAFSQGVWSAPVNVSTAQPDNFSSSVAIDPSGNAAVAFLGLVQSSTTITNAYASALPAGGAWSAATMISTTGRAEAPTLKLDKFGNVSAAWTSFLDTQIATRPAGGAWLPADTIAPGVMSTQFLVNANGDQALVWTTSLPGLDVSVKRKPAGGVWGPQQVIVQGNAQTIFVQAGRASLADNGDLIVPFEYYRLYCTTTCSNINWVMRTARQTAVGGPWQISANQAGPDNGSHYPQAAVDPTGVTTVVYRKAYTLYAIGQPGTPPATIYSGVKTSAFGTGIAGTGQATVFVIDSGNVLAIDGTAATNQWLPPVVVSGADASATRMAFSIAPNGAAVVSWNGPTTVRAAIRNGVWGAPQSVSPALPGLMPESVSINSAGQAVLGYRRWLTSWSRAVYCVTYHP
jgi:hypothetical protein